MFPSTFKRMEEDLVCMGIDFSIETRINAIEDLADLANNIDNASGMHNSYLNKKIVKIY
jgi:uncharacterized protein YsxB (DUF464 family)